MMRKQPSSEKSILEELLGGLGNGLPDGWRLEIAEGSAGRTGRGAVLAIAGPGGQRARVVVEVRTSIDPASAANLALQLSAARRSSSADGSMLVAPFLSPRTRRILRDRGVGYADLTGNVRLSLAKPALLLELQGDDRGPVPDTRGIRSLKGPASGRVVRGLLDLRPPYTITQLNDRIGVPLASIYRVIDFLESEAILEREPRGPIIELDWRALLARWTDDYGFTSSNRTGAFLDPRGALSALDTARTVRMRSAVTGSMAAMGPRAAPGRLLAIYVEDMRAASEAMDLHEVDAGTNVILAEPFDEVVFERTRSIDGITYAAAAQVAADLLTGPGRWPREGDTMVAWMSENEDAWRA
jgi:hypothetical protein